MGQKPLEFYRAFKATRKPHTVMHQKFLSELDQVKSPGRSSHLNELGESQGQPDCDAI